MFVLFSKIRETGTKIAFIIAGLTMHSSLVNGANSFEIDKENYFVKHKDNEASYNISCCYMEFVDNTSSFDKRGALISIFQWRS